MREPSRPAAAARSAFLLSEQHKNFKSTFFSLSRSPFLCVRACWMENSSTEKHNGLMELLARTREGENRTLRHTQTL
jgi:hypothetical protein